METVPKALTRYEYNAKQGIRPTMEDRHVHIPYVDVLMDRNVRPTDMLLHRAFLTLL